MAISLNAESILARIITKTKLGDLCVIARDIKKDFISLNIVPIDNSLF